MDSVGRGVRQQVGSGRSWQQFPAKLLICSLNDILYMVIILFPVQLIECTDWEERVRVGVGMAMGKS